MVKSRYKIQICDYDEKLIESTETNCSESYSRNA